MVVAAPPGIEIESMEAEGTAMIIQVLDKESFDELARMQELTHLPYRLERAINVKNSQLHL
jgi:hypothetical protein